MISGNPTTFVEGGSLFAATAAVRGKILEAGTCLFDYHGKIPEAQPQLRLVIGSGENFAEIHVEYYSNGNVQDFVPSQGDEAFESPYGNGGPLPDGQTMTMGMGFDALNDDKKFIGKKTKTGLLFASLVSSGLDGKLLDSGNFHQALTGVECVFARQNMPERTGGQALNAEQEKNKKKFPDTVLLVNEVIQADAKAATKAASKPAAAKPAAAAKATTPAAAAPAANGEATDASEYDEKLTEFLVGALAEKGGELKKKELVPLVFSGIKTDTKLRTHATKRVVDVAFLSSGPWTFANDTLSLG